MRLKPEFRSTKSKFIEAQKTHCTQQPRVHCIIIGDSIVANFSKHYPDLWDNDFPYTVNLGIGGDRIQHVWWRILNGGIPAYVPNILIHVGTNNLQHDPLMSLLRGY